MSASGSPRKRKASEIVILTLRTLHFSRAATLFDISHGARDDFIEPRTSASSRVRTSSCFFNSLSELGLLLTRAFAFVPVERSLLPRVVGLLAPLRDKVTSSAQSLVPPLRPSPLADRPRVLFSLSSAELI